MACSELGKCFIFIALLQSQSSVNVPWVSKAKQLSSLQFCAFFECPGKHPCGLPFVNVALARAVFCPYWRRQQIRLIHHENLHTFHVVGAQHFCKCIRSNSIKKFFRMTQQGVDTQFFFLLSQVDPHRGFLCSLVIASSEILRTLVCMRQAGKCVDDSDILVANSEHCLMRSKQDTKRKMGDGKNVIMWQQRSENNLEKVILLRHFSFFKKYLY